TGTGMVARELVAQYGCSVVGVDRSPGMLASARGPVEFVQARAESLPFPDASFDALTFTYLLRYVDDPRATLRELARVVKPRGVVAMLEFAVPRGVWRPLWELYVRALLPAACYVVAPAWGEVGRFLGPSIRGFYEQLPLDALLTLWRDAGLADVRARRLSLGGGVVVWGVRA